MSFFHHGRTSDVTLFLQLSDPATRAPVTGGSPEVQIRRIRDSQSGVALDAWYWDGSTFVPTPTWLAMAEFDAVNTQGLYLYHFEQSLASANMVCLGYIRHQLPPQGFAVEEHIFSDEIRIWASTSAVPVVPGDTILGRLAAMEVASGSVAQANADAVWDEVAVGHSTPGTTGYILQRCRYGNAGARQIDVTVEDIASTPIQGAQVDIYDAGNTEFLGRFYSDINGTLAFALDDGTYNLRIWATGYAFTVPEVLVVTADDAVTYQGTSGIIITPPSAPDLCVIYGYNNDAGGQPIAGACVSAVPDLPQAVGGAQAGGRSVHVETREDGYFEIELVRTSVVRFGIEGTAVDVTKTVPDAASQEFTVWT